LSDNQRTGVLRAPQAIRSENSLRLTADWDAPDGQSREIWFEVGAGPEILDRIQPHSTAFVLALTVPAMERGEDLYIDAPVDRHFLFNLNTCVVPLLASMMPALQPVKISARNGTPPEPRQDRQGASTGMSCGIDSFSTLISNAADDVPPHQKISHLVFHDVGAAGAEGRNGPLYEQQLERSRRVARAEGVPLVTVSTNLSAIYKTNFVRTHTLRNASAGLVLMDLVESYLYSSTFAYSGIHGGETWDSSTADPILLPLLSTRGFSMISANADMSRLEKTLAYTNQPVHFHDLDICTAPLPKKVQNCGECGKCGRFLLVAEARGELERYAEIFDLDRFRAKRAKNVKRLVKWAHHRNFNPNDLDHLQFLKQAGADLPLGARLAGRVSAWWTWLKPAR
jgi:hypothetical protein